MSTIAPERTIAELVEEAAARLTSEQLQAIAMRVAAAELLEPDPPPPPPDFATCCAFDLRGAVLYEIERLRELGIDDDISSCHVLVRLRGVGIDDARSLAALRQVTGWRPRSGDERQRALARELLEAGLSPEQIAHALKVTAPC